MSDNDGKLLEEKGSKFEFAVTTNSDYKQTISYDLNIETLVVETGYVGLDPDDIKIYLTDKNGNILVKPTKISNLEDFKLYTNKHNHKEAGTKITTKYVLRAWIDKDVEATEWYDELKNENKQYQYKFKININGSGTEYVEENLDTSEANEPKLDTSMIAVYYDGNIWRKAEESNTNEDYQWYDYNNKMWANSVTVTESTRSTYTSADPGTEIDMDDILTMQVWIPRYKYTVWNYNANGDQTSNTQEIEILWESETETTGEIECKDAISGTDGNPSETCTLKSTNTICTNSTCSNKTYTHPAFTFGDEELTGFWIGKFELTGSIDNITTKPNLQSIRSQSVGNFETNIMNMNNNDNIYGLNTSTDTHMIKNSEWGAVAYLSQSKYGRNNEVYINNSKNYYTGRSGGDIGGSTPINGTYTESTSTTEYTSYGFYTYDGYLLDYNTNTKTTTKDLNKVASTTGNIYGVYDMSGGAYEYTMANIVSPDGETMISGYTSSYNSGYTGVIYNNDNYTSYTGTYSYPNNKYIDKYSFNANTETTTISKLGDGIKEVFNNAPYGWHDDLEYLAYSKYSWFARGGNYLDSTEAGTFYSAYSFGGSGSDCSTRLSIVIK